MGSGKETGPLMEVNGRGRDLRELYQFTLLGLTAGPFGDHMKKKLLPLAVLAIAAVSLTAGSSGAFADLTLANEGATGLPSVQSLLTGVDPLITDGAVTSDQLASSGVALDTTPTLLSDPSTLIVDDDKVQIGRASCRERV